MNLKIYSVVGMVPNMLVLLPSVGAINLFILSVFSVPIVSVATGYILLRRYPC